MGTKSKSKRDVFINEYLNPAIHPHLDVLLPNLFDSNHGTYTSKGAWKSKYHLDGTRANGGEYITWASSHLPNGKPSYHLLYDFGRGGIAREVLDTIANESYHGMRERAIEDLSKKYGLEKEYESMYRHEITPEERKRIESDEQLSVDLSTARDIFIKALWDDEDEEARKALGYMRARGWSDEDIHEGEIGLITASIKAKVMEATKGRIANRWNGAIGDTHTIAIPFYVNGKMKAFQFRTIIPEPQEPEEPEEPENGKGKAGKYQYEYGAKPPYFYGYTAGTRNIVITEGMLDYVHAMAKKFPNLVTSGGNPSDAQIANLLRYGNFTQTYTLFFDDDKGGRAHTRKLSNAIIAKGRKGDIRIASMEPIDGVHPKDIDEWIGEMNARGIDSLDMYNKSIENPLVYDEWKPIDIELSFAEKILLKGEKDRKKRNRGFTTITPEMINTIAKKASKNEILDFKAEMKLFFSQCDKEYIDNAINHWEPWKTLLNCDIRALYSSEEEIITRAKNEAVQSNIKRLYGAMKDGNPIEIRKYIEELEAITKPEKVDDATMWEEYGMKAVSDFETKEAIESALEAEPDGIPTCITFTDGTTENYESFILEPGLTFLCANTRHGKTSILNRIAVDEAVRNHKMGTDKGVMYFTYEIDRKPLIRDLLCIYNDDSLMSGKPRRTMQTYFKTHNDAKFSKSTMEDGVTHYNHFLQKADEFFEYYVCRGGYLNIIQETLSCEALIKVVESYITEAKRRKDEGLGKDISIICLDYAQLLFTEEQKARHEEISEICKRLNDLGRQYQIPIVMPAQFNQSVLSPFHMDIRSIGEGGGFSRYGVCVIGFYNLGYLRKYADKTDEENKRILKKLGIEFLGDICAVPGIMYAKALKLRNGMWTDAETLLYWDSKLKTIRGNTNPYIANPSLAKVDGMSIETAISKGRSLIKATANRMMEAIERAKNEEGCKGVKNIVAPEDIMKTLCEEIINDEGDIKTHPEYHSAMEGDVFQAGEEPHRPQEPEPSPYEMSPGDIPDEALDVWEDENFIPPEEAPF